MLDGVTILSEVTKSNIPFFLLGICYVSFLIFICFVVASFMFGEPPIKEKKFNKIWIIPIVFFFSFISSLVLGSIVNKPYKEYKIIVDKTVSFVDFQDTYNIINQEGLIYTVTLKDGTENV